MPCSPSWTSVRGITSHCGMYLKYLQANSYFWCLRVQYGNFVVTPVCEDQDSVSIDECAQPKNLCPHGLSAALLHQQHVSEKKTSCLFHTLNVCNVYSSVTDTVIVKLLCFFTLCSVKCKKPQKLFFSLLLLSTVAIM